MLEQLSDRGGLGDTIGNDITAGYNDTAADAQAVSAGVEFGTD